VVLERGGGPFRQIFLNRNGAPANIAGTLILQRSSKSVRTISKLPLHEICSKNSQENH